MADTVVDLFHSRTMLSAVRQTKRVSKFLLDTFFPGVSEFETEAVDFDLMKTNATLAEFCSPEAEPEHVEDVGFKTITFTPGYIREIKITTAANLPKRDIGNTIYDPNETPAVRTARKLGEDLKILEDRVANREEWMAAQALTTGQCVISGKGINKIVDYEMSASHLKKVTDITAWSETTADPIENLQEWVELIEDDSGTTPYILVMGLAAANAFLNNTKIKEFLDKIRLNIGSITPARMAEATVFNLGRIIYPGFDLDIYTYNASYIDKSKQKQRFFPSKGVLLGSKLDTNGRLYGAISDVDADGYRTTEKTRYWPTSWVDRKISARCLMLQSAPLIGLRQPDAFVYAEVLA